MPVLKNAKHERFAQARFQGRTADAAYESAGYKPSRSNAAALSANQSVRDRIAELQEQAARHAIQAIAYDAKSLFSRLESQIARALEDGEHKVAMDGRQFMIRCFGYEDSPTLTHDHIANRKLPSTAPAEGGAVPPSAPAVQERRFAHVIERLRRKALA